MRTEPIIERIAQMGEFQSVDGALSLAEAIEGGFRGGSTAIIVITSETAEGNPFGTQKLRQRVTSRVGVVFGVKAQAARQDGLRDEVNRLKLAVIGRMLLWTPPDADKGFEYAGSAVRAVRDGVIWTEVAFLTSWYVSATEPQA